MKNILVIAMAVLMFSCSKTTELKEPQTASEGRLYSPVTSAAVSNFDLSSFTVIKGSIMKWGKCRVATSLIQWTATGETNITQYELQNSSNNFSSFATVATFPTSSSDQSINRSYIHWVFGNGQILTLNYRLKIYYSNGTTSFGPIASITLRTIRCDMSGF